MSVADTLEFDAERVRPQGAADTRAAPGFIETAAAGFRFARDDQTGHTDEERQAAYSPVINALRERGRDVRWYVNPYGAEPINYDKVWEDVAAERKRDPDAFKEIGDRATFEAGWRSRFASRQARDADTMQRGGFASTLAGGLVGSLTDPVNVGGMLLTGGWGGTSVAGRLLAEAGINAGIELLETPLTAVERAKQGRELTAEEIAMNLGFAAAGGAAFKGLEIGAPKALAAGGRAAGKAGEWTLDKLPVDLQAAIALRRAKPDFAMTPDETAALHVVARGTAIDATNPFAHTYDGLEAHAARIDETIAAMARWPETAATQALAPAARRAVNMPAISADFDTAWRAIIGIEGGTNRDGSFRTSPAGAIGPAQVMPGTAPEAARLAGLPFDERRYRTDAAYNQALGQAYYREMLRQFDGDPVKAAAAYNAGPGSARRGTGVRGAMARAQRAGVPGEWVSFLPAETRGYVENFRRRTGVEAGSQGGDVIELADGEMIAPARPAALDAERPQVDMPVLDREQFRSDAEWRRSQGEVDAEAYGMDPAGARRAVWIEARDQLMADQRGEVPGALWHPEIGSIDVKWGDAQTGLAKITARHPEVLDDLPALLEDMTIVDRSRAGRVTLESGDHSAVVRLDWDDKAQNWLLTAFQREEPKLRGEGKVAPSSADNMRAGDSAGASPTAGAMRDIALERAGVQMGEGVGDFGRWWEGERARTGRARSVHAVVDAGGVVRGWETTGPRAKRQLERLALEGGEVRELRPPAVRDVAAHPALRDELEAEGLAGPAVIDVAAGRTFDDPAGDPVARVADLAWHDAQAAVAARQGGEQLTFDLDDGKGERSIADIEVELKADEDAIATIESCLLPAAPAAAAATGGAA